MANEPGRTFLPASLRARPRIGAHRLRAAQSHRLRPLQQPHFELVRNCAQHLARRLDRFAVRARENPLQAFRQHLRPPQHRNQHGVPDRPVHLLRCARSQSLKHLARRSPLHRRSLVRAAILFLLVQTNAQQQPGSDRRHHSRRTHPVRGGNVRAITSYSHVFLRAGSDHHLAAVRMHPSRAASLQGFSNPTTKSQIAPSSDSTRTSTMRSSSCSASLPAFCCQARTTYCAPGP